MKTPPLKSLTCATSAIALVALTPSIAFAADVCQHPLQGGACFGVFSLVSLVYAMIAATYTAGGIVILRSRIASEHFVFALLGAFPYGWLSAMAAFAIGGATGILTYPHDASPFFFMDWFAASFVLVAQILYMVALFKLGQRGDAVPADAEEGASPSSAA